MTHEAYNEVPYPTVARPQTHIDRLAALAKLFGMAPAAVTECRVLEVGCGNGNNLIPMAYGLPASRFMGVDAAGKPLAHALRMSSALGLENIIWRADDLSNIGPEYGTFDYIIAHGLYSWITAEARDRLLSVCRHRLAEHGVALISYNTYPGGHVRRMLREMLRYHTRNIDSAGERIEQAREFLDWFAASRTAPESWQALLDSEVDRLQKSSILYHDDLAPVNEPVYFHEFAAHAGRHGLQYVGEADLYEMFDHRGVLDWLGDRLLEREQYLDFLKVRRFRHSLLCRAEIPLRRDFSPARMEEFLFSSPARASGEKWEGANRVCIQAGGAVSAVASALGEMYPLPVSFDDLEPYAGSRRALEEILFSMVTGGFAELHVYDFPCAEGVNLRPTASAVARTQARESRLVTNLCHLVVELDEAGQQLLPLLDGSRDRSALEAALPEIGPERIRATLERLAGMALLIG